MDYIEMAARTLDIDLAIMGRIDAEAEALKADYLENLRSDYDDESDGYDSFDEYVESEADDYLYFAFGTWVETLICQLIGCDESDLKNLTTEEREKLTQKYFDHFKRLSGLGNESEDI